MGGIFISYRREDSSAYAGRLRDALTAYFGAELVFRDVDRINPGQRWRPAIVEAVSSCDALLVLIGPRWLEAENDEGRRRLDDPDDIVHMEIATALGRGDDVLLIPLLLQATPMPGADDLPEPLAPITEYNAMRISDEAWDAHIARLIRTLEPVVHRMARHGARGERVPEPAVRDPSRPSRSVLGRARRTLLKLPTRPQGRGCAVSVAVVIGALVTAIGASILAPSGDRPAERQGSSTLIAERTLAIDRAGQNGLFEFRVAKPARVTVALSGLSLNGSVGVTVTNASGIRLAGAETTVSGGGTGFIETREVVVPSVYRLVLDPLTGTNGTVGVQVHGVADQSGDIALGAGENVHVTAAGQNATLAFRLPERARVSAILTGPDFDGAVDLRITDDKEVTVEGAETRIYSNGIGFVETPPLAPGRYKVVVDPSGTTKGKARVEVARVVDQTGRIVLGGDDVGVTLATPGQMAVIEFRLAERARVAATLTQQFNGLVKFSLTDAGGVPIEAPGRVDYNTRSETIETSMPLPPGSYRVVVDPQGPTTGTGRLTARKI